MFRILVAEDDDSARFLMCEVLRRAGYDPCPARDGVEALEVMEHYQCDLAVVDITMPRMDGITFTRTLREGKLVVCKKYRGSMDKVYRQYIAERLAGKPVVADHAFITHSGEVPEDTLRELTALVRELTPFEEVFVTQAGCTVSSHCGPGTLGVLFLRQPEQ